MIAIDFIRNNSSTYNIDKNKICLFAFSGSGVLTSFALRQNLEYLSCIVYYYPLLTLSQSKLANKFSPTNILKEKNEITVPLFIAKAGKDRKNINNSIDDFVNLANHTHNTCQLEYHANGKHGFDIFNDDHTTREIIMKTIHFINNNTSF